DSRQAATSRIGTWVSRSRATVDSTTPTPTATPSMPAAKAGQSTHALPVATGTASRTTRAPNTNSFRAAPYRIMPNAGPLWSSAAAAVKNRPKPSRYTSRIRSPVKEIGACPPANGTINTTIPVVTSPTTGPARKTQVVVVLNTDPFRASFAKSKYTCSTGGPT